MSCSFFFVINENESGKYRDYSGKNAGAGASRASFFFFFIANRAEAPRGAGALGAKRGGASPQETRAS
jgi:hypothetical protein